MNFSKAIVATSLIAFSAGAFAVPNLGTIMGDSALDSVGDTGAEAVQLIDTDGSTDTAGSELLLEFAGYKSSNEFGIYDYSVDGSGNVTVGDMLTLFTGSDAVGENQTVFFDLGAGTASANGVTKNIGSTFGLFLNNDTHAFTWFSHTQLNSDSYDHSLIFDTSDPSVIDLVEGSNVVVAFEDLCNTDCRNDGDYNDMVVGINDVTPVPEPGTIALLGLGLAGLGLARRRRA